MKKAILASAVLTLCTIAAPASAAVITMSGAGGNINFLSQVNSTITVPDDFLVTDVNIILNGLTHNYWGGLVITLNHGAITSTLASNDGGYRAASGTYIFDDSAAKSIIDVTSSGGTFRPETPLSAFNGTNTAGAWTLKVSDGNLFDSGKLNSWSVQLTGSPVTNGAIPEPASWAMMIAGFGLVGAVMRRRAKVAAEVA